MKVLQSVILLACLLASQCIATQIDEPLFKSIVIMESSGRNGVIGDKNTPFPAYGMYQIRKPYLQDVLQKHQKECVQKFGKQLTLEDVRTCPKKSKWVVEKYLSHYGNLYAKRTGKPLTPAILFRIHNGGPLGWKNPNTLKYVQKAMPLYRQFKKT